MSRRLRLSALAGGVPLAATGAFAECSPENRQDCRGEPWVIGEPETPIGEKWWPHPIPTLRLPEAP